MGKKYSQGIVSPKGFNLSAAEPVDQRTIVDYKVDLLSNVSLPNVYPGLKVQVLEVVDGEALREYKYIGGDRSISTNWVEVASGGGTVDPGTLPLKFTSFVFKRNVGQPATPTGGDYDNPVPAGWSDGIPVGTDPIWMSSAVLEQNDVTPTVWAEPILTDDTSTTEYQYCKTADVTEWNGSFPAEPLESPAQRTYWHDDPTVDDDWMAIGPKNAGEYPLTWEVVKIGGETGADGTTGDTGRAYKQSIVFARLNDDTISTAVVTGGGFSSPYPTETKVAGSPVAISWFDGIPAGTAKVWMTKFIFNDVDHASSSPSNTWETPSNTTDTLLQNFEFSNETSLPQDPDTAPGSWHPIAQEGDIWMAVQSVDNGTLGAWGITKIKGETGEQGQGLDIAGRDTIANILAMTVPGTLVLYEIWIASNTDAGGAVPGVVNDAYLYVGAGNGTGGTAWDNIGGITGTDGTSYLHSTVFQRAATQPATPSGGTFADPVPAGWFDGIPAASSPLLTVWSSSRFFASESGVNAGLDDWKAPTVATDTLDFDFEYAAMQTNDATPLPPDQAAGGVWHNDGLTTDYWMAKAQIINGTTDDTTWTVLRIKGETGDAGTDGVPSFLSSAYLKTNDDVSGTAVTGGTYVSPVPTSTFTDGDSNVLSWTDGIPSGAGAIWFVQVKFDQGDDGNPVKSWPAATKIVDSNFIEYYFSSEVTKPAGDPVEGADGSNSWWDDADSAPSGIKWMAIGAVINGIWPTTWDKVQVTGETGADGSDARTYIPNTMFTRCDDDTIGQTTATGGYMVESPPGTFYVDTSGGVDTTNTVGGITYVYRDGIPDRTGSGNDSALKVWMISEVFNSVDDLGVGNTKVWTAPTLLADNTSIDYQYHGGDGVDYLTKPADPSGVGSNPDSAGWYDSPDSVPAPGAYWLATKNWADGPGALWNVYLIRGEDGVNGADGTDGIDGEDAIISDFYYTSWHPYDPDDPTKSFTEGEIDTFLGDPLTKPSAWSLQNIPNTTIIAENFNSSTLASYYLTKVEDGVLTQARIQTTKPAVYIAAVQQFDSSNFDISDFTTGQVVRLATIGDFAIVNNTVLGGFSQNDIIKCIGYPSYYIANWELKVQASLAFRIYYMVDGGKFTSTDSCTTADSFGIELFKHNGQLAFPDIGDIVYDYSEVAFVGGNKWYYCSNGNTIRIGNDGTVIEAPVYCGIPT